MTDRKEDPRGKPSTQGRTVLSGAEARQGEIVLGEYGRLIWIASFVAIVVLVAILGF